jgi:hypothetical protein
MEDEQIPEYVSNPKTAEDWQRRACFLNLRQLNPSSPTQLIAEVTQRVFKYVPIHGNYSLQIGDFPASPPVENNLPIRRPVYYEANGFAYWARNWPVNSLEDLIPVPGGKELEQVMYDTMPGSEPLPAPTRTRRLNKPKPEPVMGELTDEEARKIAMDIHKRGNALLKEQTWDEQVEDSIIKWNKTFKL